MAMHSVYPVIVSEKSTAVQKKVQVNADKLAVCFGDQSLPCAKGGGSAFGAPAKPSVSGFAGERRSSGATALSALKAETKDAELVTTRVGDCSPRFCCLERPPTLSC